jgi:hypothetical protein
MATDRTRRIALGVALVVLAVVGYRAWTTNTIGGAARSPSGARTAASRSARAAGAPATAPDVHLNSLDDERPKPMTGERNLFRFRPKAAPPPPDVIPRPGGVRPGPSAPAGPPPVPPIPLRFIGIVEATTHAQRLAALVDSTGRAYRGAEGDIVAGQYRILKIGPDSIEIAYLDGRGRQTIRLSGS